MKQRVLTTFALMPPAIYVIGWAPSWLFLAAVILTMARCLHEFSGLLRQAGFRDLRGLALVGGSLLCFVPLLSRQSQGASFYLYIVVVFFPLLLWTSALAQKASLKEYLGTVASTLLSVVYVAVPLSCLAPLRFLDPTQGRGLMFLLFGVLWAGDIFAYLVGRSIGKHLLFPLVSPKKTVEGSAAGLAGSLLVAWALGQWYAPLGGVKVALFLGLVVAVAGQVGDLVESAFKRSANLKDSGAILPGHGGLLDRIDSLLFGAPSLWLAVGLRGFWLT